MKLEDGRVQPFRTEMNQWNDELIQLLNRENENWRWWTMIAMVWILVFISAIFRADKGTGVSLIGIKKCTNMYWLVIAVNLVMLLILTSVFGCWTLRRVIKKMKLGYRYMHGEIQWSPLNVSLYASAACVAGVMGGLLGIGGGMVMGPLLLELGLISQSASATVSVIVFLSSSSAVVQYLVLGALPLDYGCWYAMLGLLATVIGQHAMNYFVTRYERGSLIIFAMIVVLLAATVLMVIAGFMDVLSGLRSHRDMGFHSIC